MPAIKPAKPGPPAFIPPMLARLSEKLPPGKWSLEVKLDGFRAIAVKDGSKVQLFSRKPNELTAEYPRVVAALKSLTPKRLILDGELVALDDEGRSSFQMMQNRREPGVQDRIIYYVFDILRIEDHETMGLPLGERRTLLEKIIPATGPLKYSAPLPGTFASVWKLVQQMGLEGVIAKKDGSLYEPGGRSGTWLKIKARNEQEFVIGGYTLPAGQRSFFGSLLLGYYDKGKFVYAGACGTGYTETTLRELHGRFEKIRAANCPFEITPAKLPPSKNCRWVCPEMVCQVQFMEWTHDNILRQPSYLGLRDDKKPVEVSRQG